MSHARPANGTSEHLFRPSRRCSRWMAFKIARGSACIRELLRNAQLRDGFGGDPSPCVNGTSVRNRY